MIAIGNPARRMDIAAFDAAGGFAWWYLDWIGEDDLRVVLIPSFGLPFLPGYASAAREDRAPAARERPSLNVAIYRGGTQEFYLLQEYAEHEAGLTDDVMRMGTSRFRSELRGDVRIFEARIDCEVPGTGRRLVGTVRMEAPAIRFDDDGDEGTHAWTPLAMGTATIDLRLGDEQLVDGEGWAYHDRNTSTVPLHALGIDHWVWGRVTHEHGDHIHYLVWPSDPAQPPVQWEIEVDRDGAARRRSVQVDRSPRRRAWFGMPWWADHRLERADGTHARIRTTAVLDDGPFYLRTRIEAELPDGTVGVGVGEVVVPARVDRPLERPLVRMAVHDVHGANSMWLPLFAGPRAGRLGRLLSGLFGGTVPATSQPRPEPKT